MQLLSFLWMPAQAPCASIDQDLAHWFRPHLTPTFIDVLWGLTTPGSAICISAILAVCAAVLVWKKQWFALATMVLNVGVGSLIGETTKLIFQRPRPFLAGPWGTWGGYSFPSGHTIAATLLYGFLALAMLRLFSRRRRRYLFASSFALLIAGVGFSRIALGAHYLTDVLGAMAIGSAWVFLCPLVLRYFLPIPAPASLPVHARSVDPLPDEQAALEPALAE